MKNLILFFQKYYHLFLFGLLEITAIYSIVQFNSYHRSWMFNTTSMVSGEVIGVKNEFSYYFNLGTENQRLTLENQELREMLAEQLNVSDSAVLEQDTLDKPIYSFIPAKIISKSVHRPKNYFLLDKGRSNGVEPNMGVISQDGIVGTVIQVSEHISQVMTVLHPDFRLTPLIGDNDQSGFVHWDGKSTDEVQIDRINKHQDVEIGDSVYTSRFSAHFPAGVPVAVIKDLESDQKSSFFTIKARLTTDMSNVRSVFVINHIYKTEIDSLSNEN